MVYLVDTEFRHLRSATLADTKRVIELAKEFYDASPYAGKVSWDYNKVKRTVKALIECDDELGTVLLALDKDGTPQGVLLGVAVEPPFSSQRVAAELMWWVTPSQRASRMALELIAGYERWCDTYKYPLRTMMLIEALNGDLVEKLYLKKNYKLLEKAYIKGF